MRKMSHGVATVIIGLSLLSQTGCGSSRPSRYYLLSAVSHKERPIEIRGVSVGIGPIELPRYLDRPQIVTRGSRNRLIFAEFDRWAEPLDQNFRRILTENLASLLSTDDVIQYPWKRSTRIDYQIMVTVIRFDAAADGETVLHVRWLVRDSNGRTIVTPRTSRIGEPAVGSNYEAIVQAGSRALEEFSRRIAAAIEKLEPTGDSGGE